MAKHIDQLMAKLTNFGKQASAEATVSDPTEKGPLGTDVPQERVFPDQPGQSASTETTPAVSASEPAGEAKIEHGEPTGKVTPAQDMSESCSVEGNKSAALIQGVSDLKAKLANFGQTAAAPAATPAAAAPAAPAPVAADEATEKTAAEYVPGDALLKVAFSLMETAEGQSLVLRALDEARGHEQAQAMVKAAADETSAFLRDYTIARLQEEEQANEMRKQAAEQAEAEAYFHELTKGASAEQLQAIEDTGLRINTMLEPFTDNAVAKSAAEFGLEAAYKIAAAMEQGMSPEEAAMMASGGPQDGEEGPPSMEELEAALMTLVEQGVIGPEEAQQLMAELMSGGEGMEDEMPEQMAQKQASIRAELTELAAEILG
jgi:hypothetical protein